MSRSKLRLTVKRLWASALAAVIAAASFSSCEGAGGAQKRTVFAMDTLFEQTVWGASEDLFTKTAGLLSQLETVYSHTDPDSELYLLNEAGNGKISDDLKRLLDIAAEVYEASDGAFDPGLGLVTQLWERSEGAVPSEDDITAALAASGYGKVSFENGEIHLNGVRLNLGGIAKGAAAGQLLYECICSEASGGIISCSSSIGLTGTKPDKSKFKIGVRDPDGDGNEYIATLELSDCILSTSGDYERYFISQDNVRYHHIIDPATGYPAQSGLRSVTVVSSGVSGDDDLFYTGAVTDALSTAVFVMGLGEPSLKLLEDFSMEAVFVFDGEIYVTDGLEDSIILTDGGYSLKTAE